MTDEVQYQTGVYIMTGTLDGDQVIKVGKTTVGVDRRVSQLNADCYAGIGDWKLHTWFALDNARLTSAVEKIIHDEIEHFNIPLPNGAGGMATEVFDLSPEEAADALTSALSEMQGYIRLEAQLIGGRDYSPRPAQNSKTPQIWGMIGIILLVLFAGGIGSASAEEHGLDNLHDIDAYPTQPYPKGYANWGEREPDKSHCPQVAKAAELVMDNRQKGVPMHRQLEAFTGSGAEAEIIRALILGAYETPRYSGNAYRREAITEYGNEAMLSCYREARS